MPTISFTLSADHLARAVEALGTRWGYRAILSNGDPNPQSQGEFVRQRIAQWIKAEVQAHELGTAQAAVSVPDITVS